MKANPALPWGIWASGAQYAVDFAQRSILFWDTLRQRGNNFLEHERKGLPPVLRFDHEMVMDGRSLESGAAPFLELRQFRLLDLELGRKLGAGRRALQFLLQAGARLREAHGLRRAACDHRPDVDSARKRGRAQSAVSVARDHGRHTRRALHRDRGRRA